MGCSATGIEVFPGDRFGFGVPESIGDAARPVWFGGVEPHWNELDDGAWEQVGHLEDELSYRITMTPLDDHVDLAVEVTNESDRIWEQAMAFNCFQCGGVPEIADHECLRHWVATDGVLTPLIELPRVFGPRPTIQLYNVEGAPMATEVPFVSNFQATPEGVVLEPWMAIRSRDGKRLAVTASRPCLTLFQNMEYSCIHASPWMGRLAPGASGQALNRVYFVEASLEDWHARYTEELA
jgi:hypothetical protein